MTRLVHGLKKVLNQDVQREKKIRNFYPNEADERSLLFSLPFLKVLEWYFHYKKSYMGEK